VAAERGALTALEGSCKTPIGAHAWLEGGSVKLIVEALAPDGSARFRHSGDSELSQLSDPMASARDLGVSLGQAIKDEAGDAIVL
jgi:hydroxymethylbilane synthase